MAKDIELKVLIDAADAAKSVGAIKKSLKDLNSAALEIGSSGKGFDDLTKKAGELKNKLGDLNAQTNALNGSGVEKLTASMGILKEAFTTANPEKLSAGFKVMGAAMKAIPIFLIIEGIKFLIDNFEKLKNSGGLLGKVFTAIGDVISWVVTKIKEFLDYIGLTNFAIEEQAEKNVAAIKKTGDAQQQAFDDKIALDKASGKSTVETEKLKQQAIIKTAQLEFEQMKAVAVAKGKVTDEDIKRINELGKIVHDANLAIQVDTLNAERETKEKKEKLNKEYSDKNKSEKEKEAAELKKEINDSVKSATDGAKKIADKTTEISDSEQIRLANNDLEILKIKKERDDEAADNELKSTQKNIDDSILLLEKKIKKELELNTTLSNDLARQDRDSIDELKRVKESAEYDTGEIKNKILLKYNDEKSKIEQVAWDASYAGYTKALEGEANAQKEANKKTVDANKKKNDDIDKDNKELERKIIAGINSVAQSVMTIMTAMADYNATLVEESTKKIETEVTAQQTINDEARADELDMAEYTGASKDAINKKWDWADYELKKQAYERETAIKKKAFEVDKKMKIAQAVISTITGAISAVTGMISAIPGPVGIILGVLAGLAVTAAGVLQIAKIKATTFDSGTAPTAPHVNSASPSSASLGAGPGSNEQQLQAVGGNGTAKPTVSTGPSKVYVVAGDMTKQQTSDAVLERRASFS